MVSHRSAQHWLQTPPEGTRSLAELRRITAARGELLWDLPPGQALVAAQWDTRQAFVCAAVASALASPLIELMDQHASRSRWTTAWLLNQNALPRKPVTTCHAWRTAARISVWQQTGGQVHGLLALPLVCGAPADSLLPQLQRLASDILAPEAVPQWIDLCREQHAQADTARPATEAEQALELAARFVPHTPVALLPLGWARDGRAAPRPAQAVRQACAALGLSLLAWTGWAALQSAPMPVEDALTLAEPRLPTTVWSDAERKAWGELATRLETPWVSLLDQLTSGVPDQVRIQRIESDMPQRRLHLVTEGPSLAILLEHARQLQNLPAIAAVQLQTHEISQPVNGSGPVTGVRLNMDVALRPLPW